jgi:uncharacterized membrane protein SpoIIM required for sporulation
MAAWGMYASHNPQTAVISGSIAASTFGLGTVALLVENGKVIGSLAYEMNTVGKLPYLLVHIFPHGVPELSGLVISGAAGLVMGWALIAPGRRKRGEALMEAGKDAIVLLTTSVFLMFIAAPIEGFFSFNPDVSDATKLTVILLEIVAWAAFWIGFGKGRAEPGSKASQASA